MEHPDAEWLSHARHQLVCEPSRRAGQRGLRFRRLRPRFSSRGTALSPAARDRSSRRAGRNHRQSACPSGGDRPGTDLLVRPRAAEVDQEKDHHLEILARIQAECFSVHAAATWVLEQEAWDFLAVYYPSIDHFSHAFMNYHPPKPEWVAPHEFDLYQDVIASAYRFHDLMLARLLYLAGPDTTVLLVSDH